jgi:uncharacterized SAM-binding protein YcdF (DUF218 family)
VRIRKTLIAVIVVILILTLGAQFLLSHVGRFMAPEESKSADVLILEGADNMDKRLLFEGAEQMRSGRAGRLVLVIHYAPDANRVTDGVGVLAALQMNLHRLGLHDDQFMILRTPDVHPITLNEASVVLRRLSGEGVRTAVLMTDGFHERRSYLIYEQVGVPLGMSVTPSTIFLDYTRDNWWITRMGWYELVEEFAKTTYYYARGYLRFRVSPHIHADSPSAAAYRHNRLTIVARV